MTTGEHCLFLFAQVSYRINDLLPGHIAARISIVIVDDNPVIFGSFLVRIFGNCDPLRGEFSIFMILEPFFN